MNIKVTFEADNMALQADLVETVQPLGETFSEVVMIPAESDHEKLKNRDAADQHPIGAITDLRRELDSKQNAAAVLTNADIENILRS